MRPASLLLRLLLCLSLLANGVGAAHAATGMRLAHVAQAAVAAADAGSCHEAAPEASAPASMPLRDPPPAHAGVGDGDCCDGEACDCVCMAQASLALPGGFASVATTAHADVVVGDASGLPPPRLPHLIRPPIG